MIAAYLLVPPPFSNWDLKAVMFGKVESNVKMTSVDCKVEMARWEWQGGD